jgi:membrane protein implicated in regulation of membrane protease activity
MPAMFVAVLMAGLIAGVISMVGGIDRSERGGARVKYLNLPTFGAAATVFGIVGYPLARYSTLHTAMVVGISAAAAAGAAAAMLGVIAGWAVPSAKRVVKDPRYELQGQFARVSQPIADRAAGEIEYSEEGATHRVRAKSLDERAIESGAEVVIERIEDGIAYVERWSKIAKQLELPA